MYPAGLSQDPSLPLLTTSRSEAFISQPSLSPSLHYRGAKEVNTAFSMGNCCHCLVPAERGPKETSQSGEFLGPSSQKQTCTSAQGALPRLARLQAAALEPVFKPQKKCMSLCCTKGEKIPKFSHQAKKKTPQAMHMFPPH